MFLIAACTLLFAVNAAAQQNRGSEGPENDLDHAVKVSDDVLWHMELDAICEVRTFRYTGLPKKSNKGNPRIVQFALKLVF